MQAETFPSAACGPKTPLSPLGFSGKAEAVDSGRLVLKQEARALESLAMRLDSSFSDAVSTLAACAGRVVVTGVGKSGHIGRKIAATLASIGAPSFFMHAAEALHGDLGQIGAGDVVLVLSHSGESREIIRLLPHLSGRQVQLIAITGRAESSLGRAAHITLLLGPIQEACPLNMVPTVSTTLMLALGDALAISVFQKAREPEQIYQARHPGGTLGQHLLRVKDVMRTGDRLPLVTAGVTLREAIRVMTNTPGRPGATLIVNDCGALEGLFTDGDLRRLLEQESFCIDRPLAQVMHPGAQAIGPHHSIRDAVVKMRAHQIDQLAVIDKNGRPVGLLDVQDVITQPA